MSFVDQRQSNDCSISSVCLQLSGLKPIGSDMSKLILEYNRLAAALDTTLHVMSVSGVAFPDNHGMVSFL